MFKKKQTPSERRRPIAVAPQPRPAVFSYHAYRSARTDEGTPTRDMAKVDEVLLERRKKRRLSLWRNARAMGVALSVVLFLILDTALGTRPKVTITGDTSGQVFLRSSAVYAAAAHEQLASSFFAHNKVTIDTESVSARLLKQFPELKAVSVSLPIIGSQPVVYIQPATPKLLLATQSSGSFLLDSSGRALMSAQDVPNVARLHLPVVTDQSGYSVQVGQTALTTADVTFIDEVVGQLRAKNVAITSLTLPAASSELDVQIKGASYTVKFNLMDSSARAEVGTYLATQQYLAAHAQTPAGYIDVRVPGRAYYK